MEEVKNESSELETVAEEVSENETENLPEEYQEEKFVLVTGAYGGLGRAVVEALLEKGYAVFASDIIIDEKLENNRLMPIHIDVTNDRSIFKAYQLISEYTDSLYAIINLAGIFYLDSIVEGDEDKLRRIIDVNFFGTYKMNKTFMPFFEIGKSRIINAVSEIACYSPQPFMGYYAISKKMLDTYNDVLRRELNYIGIKVVKINAGSFNTGLLGKASDEYERLVASTEVYKDQLTKLKFMMDKELEKSHDPKKFAKLVIKILGKKNPKICYNINRSFSLRFLSKLPEKTQDKLYKKFIK